MLSVSDKSDSVNEKKNECTQEISEVMKLHIQEVWRNAHKFIRQLAHKKKQKKQNTKYKLKFI